MKLLLYRGGCASKTVHGIKFTQAVRTANVSDEVGNKFKGMTDFNVIDIKKNDIISEDNKDKDDDPDADEGADKVEDTDTGEDVDTDEDEDIDEDTDEDEESIDSEATDEEEPAIDESKVKKFMKLTLDTLREMCEAKGLSSEGTKQELATRLSSN